MEEKRSKKIYKESMIPFIFNPQTFVVDPQNSPKVCVSTGSKRPLKRHRKRKFKPGKHSKWLNPDYICYTDGSCDNRSYHRAGGSAYIVINTDTGEIERVKTHHCVGTTNNRMEMLAIISAVNYCPDGSYIEIRTDSEYCINSFKSTKWDIGLFRKNADLITLYRKCKKDKHVWFTWVKGHNDDEMNIQADCLAFGAYEMALKENNLPMASETARAMRSGIQVLQETA